MAGRPVPESILINTGDCRIGYLLWEAESLCPSPLLQPGANAQAVSDDVWAVEQERVNERFLSIERCILRDFGV